MSETTDKINKLATQHEIIGAKTDCKYFSNIGNLCSRVENGMMRCDEYLECEFKYIDASKEENEKLKKTLQEIEKLSENAYCLTNGTNKDMAEFAKTIMIKINEVIK
jgi:archaellum component FlaC